MITDRRTLPDLAGIVKRRAENPRPMSAGQTDRDLAAAIGMPVVRQLTKSDSAPGGRSALRMSNLGACARKLAYRIAGTPENGRELDARSALTFSLGDMTETLLLAALRDGLEAGMGPAGWAISDIQSVEGQRSVSLPLGPWEIPGHPDGVLTLDGHTEAVLEIKSSSSYGFSRADKALHEGREPWDPSESYWWQSQAYMHAVGVDWMGVLMLCKDSGALISWWQQRDSSFGFMLEDHLRRTTEGPDHAPRVLADGSPLGPSEVTFYARNGSKGPDGRPKYLKGDPKPGAGKLPWQCAYCAYYRTCWGDDLEERVETDYRGRPSRGLYVR